MNLRRFLVPVTACVAVGVTAPCFAQVPGSTSFQNTNPFNSGGPTLVSGPNPPTGLTILHSNPTLPPGVNVFTPAGFSVHGTTNGNFLFSNLGTGALPFHTPSQIQFNNASLLLQTIPNASSFLTPSLINAGIPTDRLDGKHKRKTVHVHQAASAGAPKPLPYIHLTAIDRDSYSLRHDGTAKITSLDADTFGLENGSVLVVANQTIAIVCTGLRVKLGAGAMVHLSVSPDCVIVRSLHDHHRHDIKVLFDNEAISVPVGTELCVGKDEATVRAEIKKDTMQRLSSLGSNLANGKFGLTSTFPLHSMLAHPLLVNMHKHRTQDRVFIEKIMRMAVCLHLAGRNGTY